MYLDVELRHADGRGEECGDGSDPCDDWEGVLACEEERVCACDQVDTCGDHRRGVDECGDRGWAFHRVGEPDIQGELCRFTKGTDHEQEWDPLGDGRDRGEVAGHCGVDIAEELGIAEEDCVLKGSEVDEDEVDTERESEVTDAVDDERFLGSRDGFWFLVEISDEQV